MSKKIAVLEVEFESDDMWDEDSLKEDMDGDWLKAMQWLFKENSLSIFDEEIKLVDVKPAQPTNKAREV